MSIEKKFHNQIRESRDFIFHKSKRKISILLSFGYKVSILSIIKCILYITQILKTPEEEGIVIEFYRFSFKLVLLLRIIATSETSGKIMVIKFING